MIFESNIKARKMWPSQVSKGQRYETSKAERTAKESRNRSIANSSETGSAFLYQNSANKLDKNKNLFNLILAGSISLAFLVCNRDKVNLKLYIYCLFFVQISKFQRCGMQRA